MPYLEATFGVVAFSIVTDNIKKKPREMANRNMQLAFYAKKHVNSPSAIQIS